MIKYFNFEEKVIFDEEEVHKDIKENFCQTS